MRTRQIIRELLLLCTCSLFNTALTELVTKCCPRGEAITRDGACVERKADGRWLQTFPPPKFSALTDGLVSIEVNPSEETGEPECGIGSTRRELTLADASSEEEWLLLVETGAIRAELYISGEEETMLNFCLEEVQDEENKIVGVVAKFCSNEEEEKKPEDKKDTKSKEDECSAVICVSVCCPHGALVKDNSNDCVDELMFEPSFVDKNQNPVTIEDKNNYKIVHGEPQCDAVLKYEGPSNRFVSSKYDFVLLKLKFRSSRASEYSLQDDGLLHIGHHTLTYSQYCLQVR